MNPDADEICDDLDGDCDDARADVHPDAPEVCDGVDQDCSGANLPCGYAGSYLASSADVVLYGEDANDPFGSTLSTGFDLDGDGYEEILVGEPGDDDTYTDAGSAFVLEGAFASGAALGESVATARLTPNRSTARIASRVRGIPDVNGDGYDEVVLSVASTSNSYWYDHLIEGPVSGTRVYSTLSVTSEGCDYCSPTPMPGNAGNFQDTSDNRDLWLGAGATRRPRTRARSASSRAPSPAPAGTSSTTRAT